MFCSTSAAPDGDTAPSVASGLRDRPPAPVAPFSTSKLRSKQHVSRATIGSSLWHSLIRVALYRRRRNVRLLHRLIPLSAEQRERTRTCFKKRRVLLFFLYIYRASGTNQRRRNLVAGRLDWVTVTLRKTTVDILRRRHRSLAEEKKTEIKEEVGSPSLSLHAIQTWRSR